VKSRLEKSRKRRTSSLTSEDGHRRRESTRHKRSKTPPPRGRSRAPPVPPQAPAPTPAAPKKDEEALDFECDKEVFEVSEVRKVKVSKARTWDELVTLNGRALKMKVDSGSTVCTISLRDFRRLNLSEEQLRPPQRRIVTYCQGRVEPLGEFDAVIQLRGRSARARVLLLDEQCPPLLSCAVGAELGLFSFSPSSLIEFMQEWEFEWDEADINAAEDEYLCPCNKTAAIVLKPGSEPVVVPPRRVPLALIKKRTKSCKEC
jgi:hypothetical protein